MCASFPESLAQRMDIILLAKIVARSSNDNLISRTKSAFLRSNEKPGGYFKIGFHSSKNIVKNAENRILLVLIFTTTVTKSLELLK